MVAGDAARGSIVVQTLTDSRDVVFQAGIKGSADLVVRRKIQHEADEVVVVSLGTDERVGRLVQQVEQLPFREVAQQ